MRQNDYGWWETLMTTPTKVTGLAPSQLIDASEVLGRAFFDDPGSIWVTPDDDERARVLPHFMEPAIRYCRLFGEAYTTAGPLDGAAGWLTPGNVHFTLKRMVEAEMHLTRARVGEENFERWMRIMGYLESLRGRDAPADYYYLVVLGVDPPRQGQGVGSALIRPVMARADAEGLPCYLETGTEIDVTFYGKHGFEVLVEGDIPDGGPAFWTMSREPGRSPVHDD